MNHAVVITTEARRAVGVPRMTGRPIVARVREVCVNVAARLEFPIRPLRYARLQRAFARNRVDHAGYEYCSRISRVYTLTRDVRSVPPAPRVQRFPEIQIRPELIFAIGFSADAAPNRGFIDHPAKCDLISNGRSYCTGGLKSILLKSHEENILGTTFLKLGEFHLSSAARVWFSIEISSSKRAFSLLHVNILLLISERRKDSCAENKISIHSKTYLRSTRIESHFKIYRYRKSRYFTKQECSFFLCKIVFFSDDL